MKNQRIVARRDSATTILRKIGIKTRDYDLFIEKLADNQFAVDVTLAEKHVKDVAAQTATPPETPKKAAQSSSTAPKKASINNRMRDADTHNTVSSAIRKLIFEGKSNKEIWAEVQPAFNLDSNKSHYPSWYRSQLKRQGKL